MRNVVRGVGVKGIVRDVHPYLLPHSVWSDGRNVRFQGEKCYGMGGVGKVFDSAVTGILGVGLVNSVDTEYVLYSTGAKVYSFDGTTASDITRASGGDYSENEDNIFTIQSFNGLGILNQALDVPQVWDSSVGTNQLTMLTNWNANWKCKYMCQFGSMLVALGMAESGTDYPHKLRISHPAEAGAVPASWDETDVTKLAVEYSFPDTQHGELTGGMELGNRFYVYKQGAIWVLDLTGDLDVVSRSPVTSGVGLYVPRSLVKIPNYKGEREAHFFAGEDNFYIMDGNAPFPVFEEVFSNEIKKFKDHANFDTKSFSVVHPRKHEVWFCVCEEGGSDFPTIAYCFNYYNGSYSIRTLSGASTIVSGVGLGYQPDDTLVDLPFSDGTYFDDGTGFYNTELSPATSAVIEVSYELENLFYLDVGYMDYDQESYMNCYVERVGLATVQTDPRRPESTIVDYGHRKLVTSFVPKVYDGSSARVTVGKQEVENEDVFWETAITLGVNKYKYNLPRPISGRFIAFKFESIGAAPFELGGFDYEVELLGEY